MTAEVGNEAPTRGDDPPPVDADSFRRMMRHRAAAVVLVTTRGDQPVGFTATSFTSVSLTPPTVSFCQSRASSSWATFQSAEWVGVQLLNESQQDLARLFATRGADRFGSGRPWRSGPRGVPLIDGSVVSLICRVVDRIPVGDHTMTLAEPVLFENLHDGARPLLYFQGGYTTLLGSQT